VAVSLFLFLSLRLPVLFQIESDSLHLNQPLKPVSERRGFSTEEKIEFDEKSAHVDEDQNETKISPSVPFTSQMAQKISASVEFNLLFEALMNTIVFICHRNTFSDHVSLSSAEFCMSYDVSAIFEVEYDRV
jgi:hypothetical protein